MSISIHISHLQIPTDYPESDGTLEWDKTDMIIVSLEMEGISGIGYTYGSPAVLEVIHDVLAPLVKGANPLENMHLWYQMQRAVRNLGRSGIASHAIAAVDIAFWDLKANLLNLPLCHLWGAFTDSVPIYGSGGFTSYPIEKIVDQFQSWAGLGISTFKMKIGPNSEEDIKRVKSIVQAFPNANIYVDANGSYHHRQALHFADVCRVEWFEEPVSSDDLEGLAFIRSRCPKGMNIAAGEYGYDVTYFRRMLEQKSVDILQIDATRCLGFTGFFQAAHLASAFHIPISSHTAPAIHLHPCASLANVKNMEYFHDHVLIEQKVFNGFPEVKNGHLLPRLDRPGHGLKLNMQCIQQFTIKKVSL